MILLEKSNEFSQYSFEMLNEAKLKDLTSTAKYNDFLKKYPTISPSKMKEGYFYSYDYDFRKDGPPDKVDYYDEKPIGLMLKHRDGQHFYLINFHHIYVLQRSMLLNRMKSMNPNAFNRKGNHKVTISASTIKGVIRKSVYAMRMYLYSSVSNLRIIPNKDFFELVKYSPDTYYKVSIGERFDQLARLP